jgi:uncharacterized protein YjbI with pentapeptide repeats
MDANHQETANNNLTPTDDVEWVVSRKSKLLIPQYKNQRKRTFKVPFDWLNLIGVLAIPFVVTFIGLYATQQITEQQAQASERQHQTDLQIAQDQQRETLLQGYLDRMSDLLLNGHLRESKPGEEVRDVARVRTLETLFRLDPGRREAVLGFLYEAGLIGVSIERREGMLKTYNPIPTIVYLNGADLTKANLIGHILVRADLSYTYLSEADMRGAVLLTTNLHGAVLYKTNLAGAKLNYADLSEADLSGANLSRADLTGAIITEQQLAEASSLHDTIVPDGSIHP